MRRIISIFVVSLINLIFGYCAYAGVNQGLFSDANFAALKKDNTTLFSKTNTCHLKALLGANNFNLFHESMSLMTTTEDTANEIAISGNVRGLFTIFEGFFRMSKSGQVWIAYLFNNEVHYFTNDEASLNQPPPKVKDWSKNFQDAKWIPTLISIKPDSCR